jgi:protein tyrosine phosphatase (PTP) superfamily phosphohydrolase (DUF442 family)
LLQTRLAKGLSEQVAGKAAARVATATVEAVDQAARELPKAATDRMAISGAARAALKPIQLDIPNFGMVNDHLYRSSLPTDAQLTQAAAAGIKTDICLLNPAKPKEAAFIAHEKAVAEGLGMKFVNIPIPYDVDLPREMSDQFIATVENQGMQPAMVHCIHGRDRTGEVVADYRIRHDHISGQQALGEMEQHEFSPETYPYLANYVLKLGGGEVPRPTGT